MYPRHRPATARSAPADSYFDPLLKNLLDHVLDGRVFHREVKDRKLGQEPGGHLRGAVLGHLEASLPSSRASTSPMPSRSSGETARSSATWSTLKGAMDADKPGELAVEHHPAVVDDDHPAAQRGDVRHVVAGEQHRGARSGWLYSRKNSRIRFCIVTSKPSVGSSRKRTRGLWRSAATSSHFIRSPRDRLRTGFSSSPPARATR